MTDHVLVSEHRLEMYSEVVVHYFPDRLYVMNWSTNLGVKFKLHFPLLLLRTVLYYTQVSRECAVDMIRDTSRNYETVENHRLLADRLLLLSVGT